MDCLMNGHSAKVIAKAVQSLSKFGSDLFIEADQDGLLLRTLNSSRSAIGSFKFNRHFFERYSIATDAVSCKITMKACFNAFRNMKQVEYCEMKTCLDDLKFQMDIKCKHEQTKKIIISIIDEENITSTVESEDSSNTITASYKVFNEISSSFNALEEEITLDVDKDSLNIKNYISGTRVNDKFMRTQFKISPTELDVYEINETASITFCLKEFRAYLAFAESINESITLQFAEAGKPLFVRIKKLDQINCSLITSTLFPEDITFCEDIRQSELMNNSNISANIPSKRKSTISNRIEQDQPGPKRYNGANETTLSNSSLFMFSQNGSNKESVQNEKERPKNLTKPTRPLPKELERFSNPTSNSNSMSVQFYDTEKSPTDDDCDERINETQNVNSTVRKIFSRCFEATFFPSEPSPNSEIFVLDSDNEN